jgi:rfaE bifunctional protein nucleotidyltransferase chain/domain
VSLSKPSLTQRERIRDPLAIGQKSSPGGGLLTLGEAMEIRQGKRLVFTNGVFDILHAGHVLCLQQARTMGDILIVGLNSDASVKRLGKGPERPLNPLEDRASVLKELRSVDAVIAFDEDTPIQLIRALQPEVYAKGGDYSKESLPETEIVESYGGRVVLVPLLPGRSTTSIIERSQK